MVPEKLYSQTRSSKSETEIISTNQKRLFSSFCFFGGIGENADGLGFIPKGGPETIGLKNFIIGQAERSSLLQATPKDIDFTKNLKDIVSSKNFTCISHH